MTITLPQVFLKNFILATRLNNNASLLSVFGKLFACLFCCFTSQVNSYGHGRMFSSPNHTFFLGKHEQAVNQYFVHMLLLVTVGKKH